MTPRHAANSTCRTAALCFFTSNQFAGPETTLAEDITHALQGAWAIRRHISEIPALGNLTAPQGHSFSWSRFCLALSIVLMFLIACFLYPTSKLLPYLLQLLSNSEADSSPPRLNTATNGEIHGSISYCALLSRS